MDDLRIRDITPLISPHLVMHRQGLTDELVEHVKEGRDEIGAVLEGRDDRLIVVVGPCSIHDLEACREYAHKLEAMKRKVEKGVGGCYAGVF